MEQNYWSQANWWMDSDGFVHWIQIGYNEVQKLSNGPWLLLMDNCGGHELIFMLDRVRIEFLPPRSTTKHQPLDFELIASAKIRYRTKLLSAILDVMEPQRNTNHSFKESSCNWKWGLQDGMLPHVGDAIMPFDSAWRMMTRSEVIKSWVRSECLGSMHVSQNKSFLYQLENNSDVDIDLVNTSIDESESNRAVTSEPLDRRIHEAMTDYKAYSQECNTPLHEILAEVEDIVQEADLINALNSPAPFHDIRTKDFVTLVDMMKMYEN